MKYALLVVTVIGIVIGLALPGAKRAPIAAAPPAAAAPAATAAAPADQPQPTVLDRADNGHFFTVANVNGEPIKFVVDTGATEVALTQDDARRAGVKFDPGQFDVVGTGAGGAVRGQVVELEDVVLDGKRVSGIHALVLDGLTISLLGQNYLRRLDSVAISGDKMTLK
ncbi:MAG: TIGR02281 family clan AA aspartic protease [Sphingomonadales bacterium]|nr:TIGR02281 family clan AA aspartic protease [Sphingomonadales bacterium]